MENPYLVFDCGRDGYNENHTIHSIALIYFAKDEQPVRYKANIEMPPDYPYRNSRPNSIPIEQVYDEMKAYWEKAMYYVCLRSSTHSAILLKSLEHNKLPLPKGTFFDLYSLAQKRLPELKSHSRESLISHLDIFIEGDDDREMNEALISVEILNKLLALETPNTISELVKISKQKKKDNAKGFFSSNRPDADLESVEFGKIESIEGKSFLATGQFKNFNDRADLDNLLLSKGGIYVPSVSLKLDYLIVGSGAGASKINKAKELIASGGKLKIISAENLYEFLEQQGF